MNEISVSVVAAAVKVQNFEVKVPSSALGVELTEMIRNIIGLHDIKLLHKGKNVIDDKALNDQGVIHASKVIIIKSAPSNLNHLPTPATKTTKSSTSSSKPPENIEKGENSKKLEETAKNPENLREKPVRSETISIFESDLSNLLTWGSNSGGKLGLSSLDDWLIPHPLRFQHPTEIKQVSCGASLTVAISESGQLFIWGKRVNPQGQNPSFKNEQAPCLVTEMDQIRFVKVSAGNNHALALDSRGDVWSWGENLHGQLGHGNSVNEFYPKRIALLAGFRVWDISAGGVHSTAVTRNRKCFAWGGNSAKQLGMFKENFRLEPSLLLGLSADSVRCGSFHTLWENQGTVKFFGNKQESRVIFESCKYFQAGGDKSFFLDDHGEMHTYDSGDFIKKEKIVNFKEMSSNGIDILVVTNDGILMAKGSNKHGELGTGDKSFREDWVAVDISGHVESVSSGTSHVAAIVKPNDLTSCMFRSNFTSDSKLFCNDGVIEVNSFLLSANHSPLSLFGQTSQGFKSDLPVAVASHLVKWLYSQRISFEIPLEELDTLHQFSINKNLDQLALLCSAEISLKHSALNYLLNFPEESIEAEVKKMIENEQKALEDVNKEKNDELMAPN